MFGGGDRCHRSIRGPGALCLRGQFLGRLIALSEDIGVHDSAKKNMSGGRFEQYLGTLGRRFRTEVGLELGPVFGPIRQLERELDFSIWAGGFY